MTKDYPELIEARELLDLIDEGIIIEYIKEKNNTPEDVFSYRELEIWALENGYIHKSDL